MPNSSATLTRLLSTIVALCLNACATDVKLDPRQGTPSINVQNKSLDPSNGGELVNAKALRTGDIILSAANGISSAGIRAITLSPVSHAALYVGNGQIIEAVTSGVRQRSMQEFIAEEATIVAFRHPKMDGIEAALIPKFAEKHVGTKYNTAGIPLTDSDPRLVTPGDLLHMRQGDVPSIKIHQALQYVGHLKAPMVQSQ
jgi:Permuted papain-like amidase enzyme, YaeF/YiiX, C92 family